MWRALFQAPGDHYILPTKASSVPNQDEETLEHWLLCRGRRWERRSEKQQPLDLKVWLLGVVHHASMWEQTYIWAAYEHVNVRISAPMRARFIFEPLSARNPIAFIICYISMGPMLANLRYVGVPNFNPSPVGSDLVGWLVRWSVSQPVGQSVSKLCGAVAMTRAPAFRMRRQWSSPKVISSWFLGLNSMWGTEHVFGICKFFVPFQSIPPQKKQRNTSIASQKFKKLRGTDHFLTFRCRKSARHCGAKHILKSKELNTAGFWCFFWRSGVEEVHTS